MLCRNHTDVEEGVRRCTRCGGPFCGDCMVGIGGRPFCAGCKNEELLDVRSGVDAMTLNHATILRRFGAQVIDRLVIGLPILVPSMLYVATGEGEEPPFWLNLVNVSILFVVFFYEAVMMQVTRGQTLGKKAVNIRVVRVDGSPISGGQAWGRSMLRLVLGCLWIVDYIPALFTKERTTVHDMVARTRVIEV
jgi:uncharacterized RDD family membrane protein YckC